MEFMLIVLVFVLAIQLHKTNACRQGKGPWAEEVSAQPIPWSGPHLLQQPRALRRLLALELGLTQQQ